MIKLNKENVLLLHDLVIKNSGGRAGVRDAALLDSAISCAYQTFGGVELYKSVEEKAARLGYGLISNHAFVDGNKRIGVLVMLTFLKINNVVVKCSDDDLIKIGYGVANSTMSYKDILSWINLNKQNDLEETILKG